MPRGKGSKKFLPPGKIGLQEAALASNKKMSGGLKSKTREPTLGITSVSQQQVEGSQVVAEEVVCDVNSASTQVGSNVVSTISKLPSTENQPSRPNLDLHHTSPPITNDNLEDPIETDEDEGAPQIHADRQPQKSIDGRTYLEPNGTTSAEFLYCFFESGPKVELQYSTITEIKVSLIHKTLHPSSQGIIHVLSCGCYMKTEEVASE